MQEFETDITIIGAGPTGLFMVFEAGMLKMKCHVVDTLDAVGGQCSALYPEKPIYDIPAHPQISGQSLIDNLSKQAEPFAPHYHLGEQVIDIQKNDQFIVVKTNKNKLIKSKALVIAAGCGAFGPNKPPIENLDQYDDKSVLYFIKSKNQFVGKDVVIAGGGDSAVDWAIELSDIAKSVAIVHRREKFRCAPESAEKLKKLSSENKLNLVVPYQLDSIEGEKGLINKIIVSDLNGNKKDLQADYLLPFFGLSMNLGPILNWGLDLDKSHIKVDPTTMKTNIEGVYAIGDVCTYKNKLKLILSGFAECATAAHDIYKIIYPDTPLHFEYSTTKGIVS